MHSKNTNESKDEKLNEDVPVSGNASQDYEPIISFSDTKYQKGTTHPFFITVMGNYMYLSYSDGITRIDLSDPLKKETKIYQPNAERLVGRIKSFTMNEKEYLIFHDDPSAVREFEIDGKWRKVEMIEWPEYKNCRDRWFHPKESQIILFDLQKSQPIIVKDQSNKITSIAINKKDQILYFIEYDDSYQERFMYSLQFCFRYFEFVKMYVRLFMKKEIIDDITQIICDMLGEYRTILNKMSCKEKKYWSIDYCANTHRLYCAKIVNYMSGTSDSLCYHNLDKNKAGNYGEILVETNLSTTGGICVDDIGTVYHSRRRNQYRTAEGPDIVAFSKIHKDKTHQVDIINILVNVSRCKDICYSNGYVYFLGYDMIGRINVNKKKF